ncbi:MAG: alpha/beta hydrolase [Fimbriimonadaceae bacterium]
MTSTVLAALALVSASGQLHRVPSLSGDVRPMEPVRSEILGNSRQVWVFVPPGYDARGNERRYPVLYMHDGQNVFDGLSSFIANEEWGADESADAMIRAGLCEPVIIVAVPNAGASRADEYLPTRATLGKSETGGKADLYGKFISEELKPLVDKEYRTLPGPQDTALCGSSFGGIVSLHLALTRPDVFGKAIVMSPSLWWDDKLMIKRVQEREEAARPKLWVDMGHLEEPAAIMNARALDKALQGKGWEKGKDLVYIEYLGARHNERAWRERFDLALSWTFPPKVEN